MKQLKEIPKFKNEDEERKFWDNVENIFDYLDPNKFSRVPPPMVPKTEDTVFLRMPHSMTESVERLSKEKKVSVEALVREFVAEGLKHNGLQPGV